MAKFRKRPVVVDAVQWQPGTAVEGVCIGMRAGMAFCPEAPTPHVHTLEGSLTVSPGDWIITGVKGEKYPCKPDVFAETYEPADSPSPIDRAELLVAVLDGEPIVLKDRDPMRPFAGNGDRTTVSDLFARIEHHANFP